MRVTVRVDSATPQEVYDLTRAFQHTAREHTIPQQIGTEPTVAVAGSRLTWTTPALTPEHAEAILSQLDLACVT